MTDRGSGSGVDSPGGPLRGAPRLRRLIALLVGAALLTAIAIVVGWRLAGPVESETPLGRVSFEVVAKPFGGIDAYVPIADWGIRADAFEAPFRLDVEIRSLDRRGALSAAGGEPGALRETREELERAAERAALRAFAWGVSIALVVALLLWLARRRSRGFRITAACTAVLGIIGAGASLLAASLTFDARAFASPSYYGRGEELAQLLSFFERQRKEDRYSSTFENALSNFSAYLADAPRVGDDPGTAIYFGSDLHNNVLVLSALGRFVDDEPFLLAGDFAHEGNEAEARLMSPRLAALSDEVVAVSGNHDSLGLMRALAEDGITVLDQSGPLRTDGSQGDGPLYSVAGLAIAGFPDPLAWRGQDPSSPDRIFSFGELDDGEQREEEAKAEVVSWFGALPRSPDIVLVHQNVLAQHLAATLAEEGHSGPLTIVTGHNHYQHVDRYAGGRINVVNAGTLGAGGPLALGQEAAGLGQLHFQGPERALRAVDLIRIEPLSGQAQAERVVLDVVCPPDEADEEACHYEPDGI